MKLKKVLKLGFFSAIFGAIAGLMLAPKSGKEFRADIKEKEKELEGKTGDVVEKLEEKAKETIDEVKETWNEKK